MGHHFCATRTSQMIARIRKHQAALPRAPLENRARAQHAPIPRSCCESANTAARSGRALDSKPVQPTTALRRAPAPAFPQALPCRAKRRDSGRAGRQQRGACTPRTRRATPAASSACSCAAAPLVRRLNGFALCAFLSNAKPREAQCAGGTRRAARGRGARVKMLRPCGRAHTRLQLRHQWSPSLRVAGA